MHTWLGYIQNNEYSNAEINGTDINTNLPTVYANIQRSYTEVQGTAPYAGLSRAFLVNNI